MESLYFLSPHTKNKAYTPGLATNPKQNGTVATPAVLVDGTFHQPDGQISEKYARDVKHPFSLGTLACSRGICWIINSPNSLFCFVLLPLYVGRLS